MSKRFFDLLLVVPLEEELLEVQHVFPQQENLSSDTAYRYDAMIGDCGLKMLVVQQEEMGRNSARDAVEAAFDEFDFGFVICLGIAGSLAEDLRLCDVCYSEHVYDFYDNTKAQETKDGELEIRFSPNHTRCHPPVVAAMNFIRTVPELQDLHAEWQLQREELANSMFPSQVVGRDGKMETIGQPRSKHCKIACAAVSKSEKYNNKIRGTDRKILAIETEIGGILAAVNRRSVHALTIRGISDYADHAKDQLEGTTGGKIRSLAASNAASFLRLQFMNQRFVNVLSRLALSKQPELPLAIPSQNDGTSLITECARQIEGKLRELAPEFKLMEKGYRIPVPRIRNLQPVSGIGARYAADPEEVREALERHHGILLGISKNYPDASLAWVIANDLLTAEIGEKQMIPIVVDGEAVKPPRIGLSQAAYWEYDSATDLPGAQVVFVIDSAVLSSTTKTEFLIKEINAHPESRFILVTRDEAQLISNSEFSAQTKAEHYQLTNVSLNEIAHFVEKNFGMTATEAELIAVRLNDTFSSFDLAAHPTYFAGLSRELLATLLQANRRAELIQLAVDGFLVLLVAGDKASIKLSRTTRARFLRNLVTELKVEKRTLTMDSVVGLAADLERNHAYGIEPSAFVTSFINAGILHLAGDRMLFSLPFIESYLLATELASSPEKALRYFNLDDEMIDLATFDLYCELAPAPEVIERVIEAVTCGRDTLTIPEGQKHILLTDAARPALISKTERLRQIEQRFQKISEDVRIGRGDVKRKQKLLDMADRVRETASGRSKLVEDDTEVELSEEFRKLNDVTRYWLAGTQMLGSGAEHLKAETKERLATDLIGTAALLANSMTNAYNQVDFSVLRKEFTTNEAIQSFLNGNANDANREETRRQIEGVVDLLEFSILAGPLRQILSYLCEHARLPVLAGSVEKANPSGEVDCLIHSLWLADIDSPRGQKELVKTMKGLPSSPFLRIIVGMHLMTRVYWNHADKNDRLRFLDAAEIALKPIISLKKGEIMRQIKAE